MKFIAKLVDISIDFNNSFLPRITFIAKDKEAIEELEQFAKKDKLSIEVKNYRESRSLSANNFLWVLCKNLADKIGNGITKVDVYKKAIRDTGIFDFQLLEDRAVSKFKETWESQGIGFLTDIEEQKNGLTKLVVYYGSSKYNTEEFSVLLDSIVNDCLEQGIVVDTDEVKRLKEERGKDMQISNQA